MESTGTHKDWPNPKRASESAAGPKSQLEAAVPPGLEVRAILDNASVHKSAAVRRWLLRHPRVHSHFTPTYASGLNLVERRLAALTTKQLRRGVHRSVRELVAAIREFIDVQRDREALRLSEDCRRDPGQHRPICSADPPGACGRRGRGSIGVWCRTAHRSRKEVRTLASCADCPRAPFARGRPWPLTGGPMRYYYVGKE